MDIKYAFHRIINWMSSFTASAGSENSSIKENEPGKFSFPWLLKIAPPTGWHHEADGNVIAFVPDGFNLSTAETVIVIKLFTKARARKVMKLKSIQDVINNDIKVFKANAPGVEFQEVEPLPIANGEKWRSFTFIHGTPGTVKNWDCVTYGEDTNQGDEFFMLFTVTSRSLIGYIDAQDIYKALLLGYTKNMYNNDT